MNKKLPVHIGPGATFDGGPYFACEVTGVHEGKLYIEDQEGNTRLESSERIQANLSEEIQRNEPISISGVHPDDGVATVYLPLNDHFIVDVHGGDAHLVGDIETDSNRADVLREATANGVGYSPNN